jgi:hypothetical protein
MGCILCCFKFAEKNFEEPVEKVVINKENIVKTIDKIESKIQENEVDPLLTTIDLSGNIDDLLNVKSNQSNLFNSAHNIDILNEDWYKKVGEPILDDCMIVNHDHDHEIQTSTPVISNLEKENETIGHQITNLEKVLDQPIIHDLLDFPIVEPVLEKSVEPVIEMVEPVIEMVEPVIEKTAEPIIEMVEPIIEKVTEPIIEKAVEPIIEKSVEPIIEKVTEPIIEMVEPIIEKAVEPIIESIIESDIEQCIKGNLLEFSKEPITPSNIQLNNDSLTPQIFAIEKEKIL